MSGEGGTLARLGRALTRSRGSRLWDAFLRGTGLAGLAGIVCVLLFPATGPLIGLAIFALWITGPLSPLFPVGLELVVMGFGRLYAPWLVAAVVMAAGLYAEFVSWHLYGRLVSLDAARSFRASRPVEWARRLFLKRPFLASWICAWSPLPFWIIRILGPLTGYPLWKALVANFLGRYPKYWLFAAVGVFIPVSDDVLWIGVGVALVLGFVFVLFRRRRSLRKAAAGAEPDAGPSPGDPATGPPRESSAATGPRPSSSRSGTEAR